MSYYYKYNFVSPEPSYSLVKEEFKSYFDTGAIDTLLFPTYLNKALDKLGRSSYAIIEETLFIEDFQARLPDNFYAVREAWMCTEVNGFPLQSANSFYSQAASTSTIQVSPKTVNGNACTNIECQDPSCGGCMPTLIQAVYKTNNSLNRTFRRSFLLKPGNVSVKKHCDLHCANFGASSLDSFDIRDNKFTTNFRKGVVHLVFYGTDYDNIGNQLIPKNYRIIEYIEAFLRYKVIETLTNQVNDETYNQLEKKLAYYKGLSDESYIIAKTEIQKQTAWEKQRAMMKQNDSFHKYELPNTIIRFGWRRNGTGDWIK